MATTKQTERERTRSERGMSLAGLLKNTPPYIKLTARDTVRLKKLKSATTKGGFPAIQGLCQSERAGAPAHKCSIIGLNKANSLLSTQKRVVVSCSCEFFMYYCEYALMTWGAARIKYSNGEPAVVRNPANVPLLCKHLVKAARAIKEHGF